MEDNTVIDPDERNTSKFGGRKFIIAILVICMSFIMSLLHIGVNLYLKNTLDNTLIYWWLGITSNVLSFYFGFKMASDITNRK